MEPRLPTLPTPDLRRKFYGESSTDDLIRKLLLTRDIARRNSEVASEEAEKQFNKSAQPHAFLPDQLVLLDEHSFLAKNQKLAPKWSGPHKILRLKGDCNVEILLRRNNKKLITHVNRLKPYFVQSPSAVSSPDFFPAQKDATPPPVQQQNEAQGENVYPYEDEILEEVTRTDPSPPNRITGNLRPQTSSSSSSINDNLEVNRSDPSPPNRITENLRRCTSSSSSVYNNLEVNRSDPSPPHQLTYADIANRPRQRLSSSSSARSSLPSDGVASQTRSHSGSFTLERPKIYMPQITFDPLPVLKEGEGLEENDNVTINIVDEHNSWTVVKRNKKNKKKKDTASEKWNKQQKENFEKFGDIWYQEPYENYRVADHDTPAAQAPQPQAQVQQQPVLQQQPAGLP